MKQQILCINVYKSPHLLRLFPTLCNCIRENFPERVLNRFTGEIVTVTELCLCVCQWLTKKIGFYLIMILFRRTYLSLPLCLSLWLCLSFCLTLSAWLSLSLSLSASLHLSVGIGRNYRMRATVTIWPWERGVSCLLPPRISMKWQTLFQLIIYENSPLNVLYTYFWLYLRIV